MSRTLLKQLANCDLKTAAFKLIKGLKGGVYKTEMAAALDLFTKLPCPETAVNLVTVCPEILAVMSLATDTFIQTIRKDLRGSHIQGFEEWMELFEKNLRATAEIQSFLLREAASRRVRVGFHMMRDQAVIYQRLGQIGMKKGLFGDSRQFFRDKITKELSAYRAVVDLICIHGVHAGRERFWNGLGAEADAQLHLQSEVLYEISEATERFINLLKKLELP